MGSNVMAAGVLVAALLASDSTQAQSNEDELNIEVGSIVYFRYQTGLLASNQNTSNKSASFNMVVDKNNILFSHFMMSESSDYSKTTNRSLTVPINGGERCMSLSPTQKRSDNLVYRSKVRHCVTVKRSGPRQFSVRHSYSESFSNPPVKFNTGPSIPDARDETLTLSYAIELGDRPIHHSFKACSARLTSGTHVFASALLNGHMARSTATIPPQELVKEGYWCRWSVL